MKGYLITFEGPDGAGKTTVLHEVIKKIGSQLKQPYIITREPGGSKISENIRQIILKHISEIMEPALKEGKIIFSDRFVDSSLAYQGKGRGLGIDEVKKINDFATSYLEPDLTLFLDIDPAEGLTRIKRLRPDQEDRLEQEKLEFHQKVYEGYKEIEKMYPERVKNIDASVSLSEVVAQSVKMIKRQLPEIFK